MAGYSERPGNVFNYVQPAKPLAHCISSDYALGAGIAKQVEARYHIRNRLMGTARYLYPDCIITGEVVNIVTKDKYWNKPTYQSFQEALKITRDLCLKYNITTLVMPRIGSGLDKLDWNECRRYIQEILVDGGINVEVYYI